MTKNKEEWPGTQVGVLVIVPPVPKPVHASVLINIWGDDLCAEHGLTHPVNEGVEGIGE